jgi:UDP-glucuronate 4-epimerase
MVELLEQTMGVKAQVERLPPQPGDVPITYADVSRARRDLGYAPRVTLEDGLQRFVAWFRAEGAA